MQISVELQENTRFYTKNYYVFSSDALWRSLFFFYTSEKKGEREMKKPYQKPEVTIVEPGTSKYNEILEKLESQQQSDQRKP